MNILHLLSRLDTYDAITGALDLATQLNSEGHNCIIASSLDDQIFESRDFEAKRFQLLPFERNIKNFFVSYRRLKEIIKINKVDVVHAHSALSNWLAFLSCRHTDRPVVGSCYNFYSKNILNYSSVLAKSVIVHNEAIGKHLINNFKLPRDRLNFIKQSLDLNNFDFQDVDQRSKTDFNIGIISPLNSNKEYEYFLKAMVKVVRIVPHIRIWVISYKSKFKQNMKDDLQNWVRRLGLANYVKFLDDLNFNLSLLSKLNLLVFSSFEENATTRPILEAQAYGVPVIATRVAGVAELINNNKTGLLVSPHDSKILSDVITKSLKDFSLMREISISARKFIENNLDLEKNVKSYIEVYKQAKNSIKILAINTGKVQDVISSIPALKEIKERIPQQGSIISLVNPSLRCLLRHCPYVDQILIYGREGKHQGIISFMRILKLLMMHRFDLVIDFNNTFKTHILSYFSLANKRYGYSNNIFSKFLINCGIKKTARSTGLAEDKLNILKPLGFDIKDGKLELWPSPEDIEFADSFFKDSWIGKEKIIGMDISLKKAFLNDSKILDYIAYLCDKLTNQKMRVILFGLIDDNNASKELLNRTKSKPIIASRDASVIQLACLIKKCDIYISLNQEFLCMALAMKIPSIILSKAKNGFDFSKYKNIEVVTNRDLNWNKKTMENKRHARKAEHKDRVIEAIDRLLQVK